VEAFTNWDFCDGAWLGAPAGLVRLDGSHKPSYDALKQRIWQDWHTDVTLMTDENGECTVEGFRGEYQLSVDGKDAAFTLSKTSGKQTIQL
ncbi:MAG: 1,4-beta-xylanase, partial [Clostridia bacterium]|nr:1,4-beta-xylanase [Clostridia bacterium]